MAEARAVALNAEVNLLTASLAEARRQHSLLEASAAAAAMATAAAAAAAAAATGSHRTPASHRTPVGRCRLTLL